MKTENLNFRSNRLSRLMLAFAGMLMLTGLVSCGDDDTVTIPEPTLSIVQIAQAEPTLSSLVAALTKFPDLVSALSSDAEDYTVFAPNNAAFAALLSATGQTSLDDVPEPVIRRLLEYHVVSGAAVFSSALMDGQTVDPILADANDVINVGVGTSVTVDNATVILADVPASNGVVHVIDGVLVPDLETSIVNTVVEPAYFNVDFEILTSAVVKAGLLTTLIDGAAEFTVFAPTDAAFGEIGITSAENLTADALTPILQYHVLDSEVKEADLPATGTAVPTLNGDFYLSKNTNGVFINGRTQVTATDIDQDNGVVHVINRTLEPASSDVVEIAIAASTADPGAEFTQLVAALTAVSDNTQTDLITILKGNGPFTIFAPTDAAFQRLYDALNDPNGDNVSDINDLTTATTLETISTVLQYHVLGLRVFSTDIPNVLDGSTTATLDPLAGGQFTLNSTLTITPSDMVLDLNLDDAAIVGTDILGTNGVIHTIDQVILP
ncbi:MAG: fasciclin domain-containing protein [Bacteroidota bacterium]